MFSSTKQKGQSWMVFGIYLVLLVWLVLFKLSVDWKNLPDLRGINLIPFGDSVMVNGKLFLSEIIYNVLAFVPLGVYVELFCRDWTLGRKLLPGLCLSLTFEILQYVFAIGASDITDLLANTFGGLLGVFFHRLLRKLFREKTVTAVNVVGLLIEATALGLIVLLTAANW